MEEWIPNQEGLNQLVSILQETTSESREKQKQIRLDLEKFNNIPDYNNYLTFIFKTASLAGHIRSVAGLLLKTNVRSYYQNMPRVVQNYIKREILPVLSDPNLTVRHTVSNIDWKELMPLLIQALDSPDQNLVEGSLHTISLLCEDHFDKLDSEDSGRTLNYLVPKLLDFFKSTNAVFRKKAITSLTFLIPKVPGALLVNMDRFLQGIFSLSGDPNYEVRVIVCKSIVRLVEIKIEFLSNYIREVIQFMLHASKDPVEEVALEACEFWSAISNAPNCRELLKDFLPTLIPILLNGMVYSNQEWESLDHGEDAMTPDRPQDIKPFIQSSKVHGGGQSQTDAGFSSAYALDILSQVFDHEEYLSITLPLIEQKMNESNPWQIRESAILALGAIADGSKRGLAQHLSNVVPYLINTLNDPKPLVRSITCWTLSRYSNWIAYEGRQQFLHPLITNLLNRILDNNKKVQEAACSAFATLEEEADLSLVPHLNIILVTFVNAFSKYQAKNLLILYDAISTLAKVVGKELNQPDYVKILIPPLLEKFNSLEDNNKHLLPLLGCLNPVCSAVGVGLQNLILVFFNRAIKIIEYNLVLNLKHMQNPDLVEKPDSEFIVSALDLLQGLTEGIETGIESLIPNSNLPRLILECMKIQSADVLQSSFALLGDMVRTCLIHFKSFIPDYMRILMTKLQPEFPTVCNNASWAIGEIAIRCVDEVKPFIPSLLDSLIPNVIKINLNRNLQENTAITIGRLGLVSPQEVSARLDEFIQGWCMAIRRKRDGMEKDSAFRGMWMLISNNPNGGLKHLVYICDAIASWSRMEQDLHEAYYKLLHMYKNAMGDVWPQYYSHFPEQLREILNARFQLDK
eukprot:gene2456-3033_t